MAADGFLAVPRAAGRPPQSPASSSLSAAGRRARVVGRQPLFAWARSARPTLTMAYPGDPFPPSRALGDLGHPAGRLPCPNAPCPRRAPHEPTARSARRGRGRCPRSGRRSAGPAGAGPPAGAVFGLASWIEVRVWPWSQSLTALRVAAEAQAPRPGRTPKTYPMRQGGTTTEWRHDVLRSVSY